MTCAMAISRENHLASTETGALATNINLMARQATNVGGDSQGSQRYTGYGPGAIQRCLNHATASGSRMAPIHHHRRG